MDKSVLTNLLEKLSTFLASKLFEPRVDQAVCLQLVLQPELLVALPALEGRLLFLTFRMSESEMFVGLYLYLVGCPLSTHVTEIERELLGLSVVLDKVMAHLSPGLEGLPTHWAGLLSKLWQLVVCQVNFLDLIVHVKSFWIFLCSL